MVRSNEGLRWCSRVRSGDLERWVVLVWMYMIEEKVKCMT